MKIIKILGTGCANCVKLENNTKLALKKIGMEAEIQKITDIQDIMAYRVMGTPGLVIDEKVVSSGRVNDIDEIVSFLQGEVPTSPEAKKCCGNNTPKQESCCPSKSDTTSCCGDNKKESTTHSSSCCTNGKSCDKKGCNEKVLGAIRIVLLTSVMTAIFSYLHGWEATVWLKSWGLMLLIALPTMCLIIRPFIIAPLTPKIGEKAKKVGMLVLMLLMSVIFTYRFNGFSEDIILNLVKNFGLLFVIAVPLVFIVINPLLSLISKKNVQ